jgi:hypothetical protein
MTPREAQKRESQFTGPIVSLGFIPHLTQRKERQCDVLGRKHSVVKAIKLIESTGVQVQKHSRESSVRPTSTAGIGTDRASLAPADPPLRCLPRIMPPELPEGYSSLTPSSKSLAVAQPGITTKSYP